MRGKRPGNKRTIVTAEEFNIPSRYSKDKDSYVMYVVCPCAHWQRDVISRVCTLEIHTKLVIINADIT